jgi:hypothetical protein
MPLPGVTAPDNGATIACEPGTDLDMPNILNTAVPLPIRPYQSWIP